MLGSDLAKLLWDLDWYFGIVSSVLKVFLWIIFIEIYSAFR